MDTSALFVQQLSNYAVALQELTFNSKPIINNLTITAGESKSCAEAIARLIEQRIASTGVEGLPVLYLLDSISKNIGAPYVGHFAARLPETFRAAYAGAAPAQRSALMHLLRTWPSVFGAALVARITAEAAALDAREGTVTVARSSAQLQRPSPAPPAPRPTSVAADRVAALLAKSRSLAVPLAPLSAPAPAVAPQGPPAAHNGLQAPSFPYNAPVQYVAQPHTQAAPQVDLQSLLGQLASVVGGMQNSAQPQTTQGQNFAQFQPQTHAQPQAAAPSHSAPYYAGVGGGPAVSPYQPPPSQPPQFFPPHSQPPPHFRGAPQGHNGNFPPQFSGGPPGGIGGRPPHGNFPPHHRNPRPEANNRFGAFPHRERAQPPPQYRGGGPGVGPRAPTVVFDGELMKVRHRSVVEALYGALQVQCKSCGLRFSEQSKMEPHMDWHFKRNRREKTKLKKPLSRSWFLETHEWNAFEGREIFTQTAPFFEGAVQKEETEEESVVLADDRQPACSMCSEEFEKFWDSDEEDWMYRDARLEADTLVHPHCLHAAGEALRSPGEEGPRSPTAELTLDAFKEQQFSPPIEGEEAHVVPSSSPSSSSPPSLSVAPSVGGGESEGGSVLKTDASKTTVADGNLKGESLAPSPQALESIVGDKRTAAQALGDAGDPKRRREADAAQ